ncbi:MAG: tRNA (adenosine(37)-N6)-threonylcarbamoyltransferase complex ATPase subunit type 1 TsaE [Microthrixaceae bacterium]
MIRLATHSPDETAALGAAVAARLRPRDVIVLTGGLGAGKTAFVKAVSAALGIVETVRSPTFTLLHRYEGVVPVQHFDVYRLGSADEAADLGIEELLDDDVVSFIEWGEQVIGALPGDFLHVTLRLGEGDDDRFLEMVGLGRTWPTRLGAWTDVLERWVA